MSRRVPIVVLAAPGAGGAQLASALAEATGRPLLAHDEVADEPMGDGEVVRTACRRVLWRRERDWTCPPAQLVPDEDDAGLAGPLLAALRSSPAPVVHDVALPFVLPLLADEHDQLLVVVAVRDPREALPHLLSGQDLAPDHADELLRTVNGILATVARHDGVVVGDCSGEADLAALSADLAAGLGEAVDDAVDTTNGVLEGAATSRLPAVELALGAEDDVAVDALRERAGSAALRPVATSSLLAAASATAALEVLDRYAGPRTAARRAQLRGIAVRAGARGGLLECTRARDLGAWVPEHEPVEVVTVDSVAAMRRAVDRPPASVAAVLLPDAASWWTPDDVPAVLALAKAVVRHGGTIVVGRAPIEDEVRTAAGLGPLDDDQVVAVAQELGLVPLPALSADRVRGLPFAAQTPLAVRIKELEEGLDRRTEQRDAAVERFEALRARKSVRAALRVADALGAAARRVRRVRGGGGG